MSLTKTNLTITIYKKVQVMWRYNYDLQHLDLKDI